MSWPSTSHVHITLLAGSAIQGKLPAIAIRLLYCCQMLGPPARSSFAKLQLWWVPRRWSKLKIGAVGSISLFLCIYSVGEESKRGGNEAEFYADVLTSHRRISKGLEGEFDSDGKKQETRCLSRSLWSISMESLGQVFRLFLEILVFFLVLL